MAITLSERARIAGSPTLRRRLRQALAQVAAAVAVEDPPNASRAALAVQVTQDPSAWTLRFAIGVANNPNVGTGVSDPTDDSAEGDDALLWVIGQLWPLYAPNYGPPVEPEPPVDDQEPEV